MRRDRSPETEASRYWLARKAKILEEKILANSREFACSMQLKLS